MTIFFSDIENSTALNSELGDEEWVKLLAAHDRLVAHLRRQARRPDREEPGRWLHGGVLDAELALGAPLDIQRALSAKRQRSRRLRRTPIRVRIGLHAGTAIQREGDYFGRNVAMAARVASMADGGEILVSTDVAEALADSADFAFVEEDTVEFKGLPGEHRLWRRSHNERGPPPSPRRPSRVVELATHFAREGMTEELRGSWTTGSLPT